MNELGLTIAGLLLVIIIIICFIYEGNRSGKKFKKDVEELKIGNRYKKMKKFRCVDDNPFNVEPIVEIIDIKFNHKNELFVQYKQIVPEYNGETFSDSFEDFIDYYELIK